MTNDVTAYDISIRSTVFYGLVRTRRRFPSFPAPLIQMHAVEMGPIDCRPSIVYSHYRWPRDGRNGPAALPRRNAPSSLLNSSSMHRSLTCVTFLEEFFLPLIFILSLGLLNVPVSFFLPQFAMFLYITMKYRNICPLSAICNWLGPILLQVVLVVLLIFPPQRVPHRECHPRRRLRKSESPFWGASEPT